MIGSAPEKRRPSRIPSPQKLRRRFLLLCRRIKVPTLSVLSGCLLTFVRLFSIPSPFACVITAAAAALGESPLFFCMGSLAALGLQLLWGVLPDPWQVLGCLILALFRRFYFKKPDWKVSLWVSLSLLPRAAASLLLLTPVHGMLSVASMVMGAVCVPAFLQAGRLWRESKEELAWDDRLCLALIAGLFLCSLGFLHLFGINLGLTAANLITLCLAFGNGSGAGAVAGLLTGLCLALVGHSAAPVLALCSAGLAAGHVRRLEKKWLAALVFVLSGALAMLIDAPARVLSYLFPALAGGVLFLGVREGVIRRLCGAAGQLHSQRRSGEDTYAAEMLSRWEEAIAEMSESLPALPQPEEGWQHIRSVLCSGCSRWSDCWQEDASSMADFLSRAANGEIDETDPQLSPEASLTCPRLEQLPGALAQAERTREADRLRTGRARLEQAMIRTHLTAMAQAVRRLSAYAQGESLGDLKGAMDIERVLKETGFPAHLVYVRRPAGHLQCLLESDTAAFTRWQPQRLISDLWSLGGLSMEITQLERSRMHLEETPLFRIETGTATLGMEKANGDGTLCMRLRGGRYLLALSDGMGHGAAARQQSQETLNLLRLCLSADYTRSQAITAVNGMMLSATGGDRFATVDLWTVDLWNGLAQVDKLGACQSCLWREGETRMIEGAALPLGILEDAAPVSRQFRLRDNDLILIFTDGIFDAFEDETALMEAVSRCVYQDPQRTADALLRQALISAGGVPRDDMTLLAARVTQWSAPASPISYAGEL